MDIQKAFWSFFVVASLISLLLIFIFDRYEYQDYDIQNCSTDKILFSAQLIGSFSETSPFIRGSPYYMRFEMKNLEHELVKNVISVQVHLVSRDISKHRTFSLSKDKSFNRATFLIENINIPYDNYLLKGVFISKTESGLKMESPFKCDVTRTPSSKYRVTLIDNLLSV